MRTLEDIQKAICKADFIKKFENACNEAGGGRWISMKDLKFEEAVDILCVNGIRMIFDESAHIEETRELAHKMLEVCKVLEKESS